MNTIIKTHNEEGISRPRAVAHALRVAQLLAKQKSQMAAASNLTVLHEQNLYLTGAILYFMILRIEHCSETQACDPSKSALFYWLDDTFRRAEMVSKQGQEVRAQLQKERGDIVAFLWEKQPAFEEWANILHTITPYDFVLSSIPQAGRLVVEHFTLLSRVNYHELLQYLLRQYSSDGTELIKSYRMHNQLLEARLLMRSIVSMRSLARGFGQAALFHQDYLIAAESFAFSGDLFNEPIRKKFLSFVEQEENIHPETCEHILAYLDLAKVDWFAVLKQTYQEAFSRDAGLDS
ncbi:MAG: hypothetical protein HY817_04700 [Candidatus Abawacabacteria bacterium]|nr:hypothetical protein [Candidatus Abawacabacteria bacterium]